MARKTSVPPANREVVLECIHQNCPSCGQKMWSDYDNERTIRTLEGVVRLTLKVRRCPNRDCERYHQVYTSHGQNLRFRSKGNNLAKSQQKEQG
jgi:hypothetical protein